MLTYCPCILISNFHENWIKIQFSFNKVNLNMSSTKCQPFWSGLNVSPYNCPDFCDGSPHLLTDGQQIGILGATDVPINVAVHTSGLGGHPANLTTHDLVILRRFEHCRQNIPVRFNNISMAWCKRDITPLLMQWSYVSFFIKQSIRTVLSLI